MSKYYNFETMKKEDVIAKIHQVFNELNLSEVDFDDDWQDDYTGGMISALEKVKNGNDFSNQADYNNLVEALDEYFNA